MVILKTCINLNINVKIYIILFRRIMFVVVWFLILRTASQLRHSLAAQRLLQQARGIKPVCVDIEEKSVGWKANLKCTF